MVAFINKTLLFIKQSFGGFLSIEDILLIKNTGLFVDIPEEYLHELPKEILHFKKGQLITKAGQYSNHLFIIKQGMVTVFRRDECGRKICTAKLSKGDFFGEPEIIGKDFKTRSGNVEAIEDVEIIKIERIENRSNHKKSIPRSHFGASGIGFNKAIEKLISQAKNSKKIHVPAGKVFFDFGDKADFVYIILRGEVIIILPNSINKQYAGLVLHEGHLFGEEGVLQQHPRKAQAIAKSPSILLKVASQDFYELFTSNQELQDLYKSLHNLNQIPLKGVVNQYIGTVEDIGTIVTNSYELEDGEHVSSNVIVDHSIFNMSFSHFDTGKLLHYEREGNTLDLYIHDERLVSIHASNFWDIIPGLCNCLLNKEIFYDTTLYSSLPQTLDLDSARQSPIAPVRSERESPSPNGKDRLEVVAASPHSKLEPDGSMTSFSILPSENSLEEEIICPCMSLTRSQLKASIDSGITSLESLSKATGVTLLCEDCKNRVLDMLGVRFWRDCLVIKGKHLDPFLKCHVKSTESTFTAFHPGQHLSLQGRVNESWIEKSFYILEQTSDNELEIIVNCTDDDLFTRWLVDNDSEQLILESSQPRGTLVFNVNSTIPAFCIVEKIGFAPIFSFIQQLVKTGNDKRVHVMFHGTDPEYIILKSQLNEYSRNLPTITLNLLPDSTQVDAITKFLNFFEDAEIYICGTQNFVSTISANLNSYEATNKLISETIL